MQEVVTTVLPVLPFAATAVGVVLLVGLQVAAPARPALPSVAALSPVRGPAAAALLAVALLALSAGARLLGGSELDNPVSPLVVGLGWPLLVLVPLLLSPVLPDAVPDSRPHAVPDTGPDTGRTDVRPAVPVAVLVVLFLAVVPGPARPEVLSPALAAYLVLMVGAALAGGLDLAARADALGLMARWAALGPRLPGWQSPRGATAVVLLVLGGAWAERAARTEAWTTQVPGTGARLALLGVGVGLAAVLALPLRRHGSAAVLLPVAVGAVVAGGLRRALISLQLLRDSVLGPAPLDVDPLGVAGGQLLALGVVVACGSVSAAVLARRAGPAADRLTGLAAVLALTGVTAWLGLQP